MMRTIFIFVMMSCHMTMSSIVDIDQPGTSGLSEVGSTDRKDDVFAPTPPKEQDQMTDLTDKFEQMQTAEPGRGPVTDLYFGAGSTITYTKKEDGITHFHDHRSLKLDISQTSNNAVACSSEMFKPSVSATYTVYACQTATDTLIEGIRSSVRQILSMSTVPKIIINSVPERRSPGDFYSLMKTLGSNGPRPLYNANHGKVVERHRRKDYFQPYCLLSRRHYTCQPLNMRRRKYGVSQKSNAEPGVNELTQLLEKLATNDRGKTGATADCSQQTLQYSPPHKYYTNMIKCQPSTKLAKIKERSRSLSDISLQGLNIDAPTLNAVHQPCAQHKSLGSTSTSTGVASTGSSGAQMSNVVSGIGKLNMSG